MTEQTTAKPPIWFWIISVIALLWNGAGVNFYLQQAYNTESFQAMYTPEQLEMINNTPSWVTAAFALAVFAGILGSIGLLLRKKWSRPLFLLSLIAILAHQIVYNIFMSGAMEEYGMSAVVLPIVTFLIGLFLLWYSRKGIAKGWLK